LNKKSVLVSQVINYISVAGNNSWGALFSGGYRCWDQRLVLPIVHQLLTT